MTPAEVASELCVTKQTLANWRHMGRFEAGLPYVKMGKKVLYRESVVEGFKLAQERGAP